MIDRGVFTFVSDVARKLRRYINAYSASTCPIQWKYSRRKTLPAISMLIGGIGLVAVIVCVTYQFAYSKDDAGRSLPALEVSLFAFILSVYGIWYSVDATRHRELLAVEGIRPHLIPVPQGDDLLIENLGERIAFHVTLYNQEKLLTIKELGVIRPHEKVALPSDVSAVISANGIDTFCTCQFERWRGTSSAPTNLNFATEFFEFDQPFRVRHEF